VGRIPVHGRGSAGRIPFTAEVPRASFPSSCGGILILFLREDDALCRTSMSMISSPDQVGTGVRPLAATERDAALARISRVRRWMIAAAAALSAGIAALVSSVAPGHTLRHKSSEASPSSASGASGGRASASRPRGQAVRVRFPPLASPADLGLKAPSSAPAPAPSQAATAQQPKPAQSAPAPQPAPVSAPAPAVSGGS
jgi:hypothetical protein